MRRALSIALSLVFVTILAGVTLPGRVDPIAYRPPPGPALAGPLATNDLLGATERIDFGRGSGPEDVERDAEGRLYAGLEGGVIARADLSGAVELFSNTGGRPLGLDLDSQGTLWVADAARGLVAVSADGQVRLGADRAAGVPIGFADDVDTGPGGRIYLSDASIRFTLQQIHLEPLEARPWGRLLEHDPASGETRVLLDGLYFANGVAVAGDGSFALVAETFRYRVRRVWLDGPRAGRDEVFADNLPGFPDGVSLNPRGGFWVALYSVRSEPLDRLLHPRPWLKRLAARLPAALLGGSRAYGLVIELDSDGRLLRSLHDPAGETFPFVTSAEEWDGALYLGSINGDAVGRLRLR